MIDENQVVSIITRKLDFFHFLSFLLFFLIFFYLLSWSPFLFPSAYTIIFVKILPQGVLEKYEIYVLETLWSLNVLSIRNTSTAQKQKYKYHCTALEMKCQSNSEVL